MFDNLFQKSITPKNIIFFVITILFLIFISKIQEIAIMFFASYVIACSLNPLVDKLEKKFKRNIASIIVLTGSIVVICAFFIPLFVMGIHEIKSFAEALPQHGELIKNFIANNTLLAKLNINIAEIDFSDILPSASGVTSGIVNSSINIGKNIGTGFVYLIISIIIIFYFMSDKETIRKTTLSMFPSNMQDRANDILNSISEKIGGYIVAQVTTMASVGIVVAIGLLLFKVEYAVLLGLIAAVLDIIPVIGPAIAFVICVIATIKSGPVIVACVIGVFAAAQLIENNFVRPYVFSKFLKLHPLIIYLFLLITAKYLGIIGVVFAPAIAATVVVLVEELYIKNMK